jgi:hypothetical protein
MRNFIILSIGVLMCADVNAQAPALQAENSFGGSDIDHAFSIQQTRDGGFIFAGNTKSNDGDVHGNHAAGEPDFWVVKLNKTGSIQWQKCLGGTNDETAFSIQQTTDGGYIVAGEANSNGGQVTGNHGVLDFWVVKLDSAGNLLWEKSLGGSRDDFATSIRQTKDGGYIVAGGTLSEDGDITHHHGTILTADYWVVKLDASGNIQWEKTYGGSRGDVAMSVVQTKDGGYIVAGNSTSDNGDVTGVHDLVYGDAWIIKIDKLGKLQWQKTFGGSDYEQANSIQQTKDGGYVSCGWTRSSDGDVHGHHGNYDFWVLKLDSNGILKWQQPLGGSNGDLAYSIEQTKDNGYIVAGGTVSNDGQVTGLHGIEGKEDFWVVKLDGNGGLQWQQTLGGSEFEEGRSVDQTKDGGYIVAGWSGFANVNNGDVTGNHGNYDCWIAKLSANPNGAAAQNIFSAAQDLSFELSPNPARSVLQLDINSDKPTLLLRITNNKGNTVIEKKLSIDKRKYLLQLDVSKLYTGIYHVSITSGKDVVSRQFVKE